MNLNIYIGLGMGRGVVSKDNSWMLWVIILLVIVNLIVSTVMFMSIKSGVGYAPQRAGGSFAVLGGDAEEFGAIPITVMMICEIKWSICGHSSDGCLCKGICVRYYRLYGACSESNEAQG
jgi:hypothetical protein